MASLFRYFLGVAWFAWAIKLSGFPMVGGILAFLLISPAITLTAILPRYREMYPGLAVLRSRAWFLAMYVMTQALVFLFTAVYVRPD